MSLSSKLIALSESKPVPKSFEHNGERIEFFVKVLTAGEVEDIGERTLGKKNKDERVRFRSRMISAAVVDAEGNAQIPVNVASKLSNALSKKLWEAVDEVNNFADKDDEDEGEGSPGTTDSD